MSASPPTWSLKCDHGLRRQAIVESLLRDVFHGRLRPGQHLVLDMTRVESAGGAALGALVGLHKRLSAAGGRLTLEGLSPLAREAISSCNAFTRDFFAAFLGPLEEELGVKSSHTMGRSHSAAEYTTPEDAARGAEVLATALERMAF